MRDIWTFLRRLLRVSRSHPTSKHLDGDLRPEAVAAEITVPSHLRRQLSSAKNRSCRIFRTHYSMIILKTDLVTDSLGDKRCLLRCVSVIPQDRTKNCGDHDIVGFNFCISGAGKTCTYKLGRELWWDRMSVRRNSKRS